MSSSFLNPPGQEAGGALWNGSYVGWRCLRLHSSGKLLSYLRMLVLPPLLCSLRIQGRYQQLMSGQLTVKIPVQPAKGRKRRSNAKDTSAAAAAAPAAAAAAAAAAERRAWDDDGDEDDAIMAALLAENDCYDDIDDTFNDLLQDPSPHRPRSGAKAAAAAAGARTSLQQHSKSVQQQQQQQQQPRKRARKEGSAAGKPPKPQAAKVPEQQVMIAKDALVGLRSALAIRRNLPRQDAVCSAVQMQEMAKCGAVVSVCVCGGGGV